MIKIRFVKVFSRLYNNCLEKNNFKILRLKWVVYLLCFKSVDL